MHMCIIFDCCIWVLCHHNQCEPPAARMMHAQRCVYAAAVIWLRTYRGVLWEHDRTNWIADPSRALVNSWFKDSAALTASVFSFNVWSPTVVHLQWSVTSCTVWYDSMQRKGSCRSDFCPQLTTLILQPALLQMAVYLRLLCAGGHASVGNIKLAEFRDKNVWRRLC